MWQSMAVCVLHMMDMTVKISNLHLPYSRWSSLGKQGTQYGRVIFKCGLLWFLYVE